ncbi:MAG: NAD-binding protein [Betaproteobacteria bacterium]|nr:NAD-binding protein [Betaproteobacteria bacterium]
MAIHRIGFVGIGNMGWPMAANLAHAGFELTVHDARPERAREFAAQCNAVAASSLADLAARVQCVVTMVPDHHVVRQVVLGDGGDCVAAGLQPGAIVADMGTSDPMATRSLGAELSARGIRLVDAPVMGGVPFACDASLDIMAAGEAEALDAMQPVFAALGRKVYRCGAAGSGHALKAINNYINACALINVIEGLTIGAKFGIDTALMIDTMQAMCTGRNHPIDKKIVPQVVTRKYAAGMPIGFIAKDLRIAVDTAQRLGAAAPLAEKVLALWQAAGAALGPACDHTEIVRYWERESGVQL